MGARTAINAYLDGRIREDNIRFRDYAIDFQRRSPDRTSEYTPVLSYTHLSKEFSGFSVDIAAGVVGRGEVIGVLGPNATGKTTFIRMLAGAEKPDRGSIDGKMTVSYKPQYISAESGATVEEVLSSAGGERMRQQFYVSEVMEPMELRHLMDKKVDSLSGGELQRVAISLCLLRDADVYLIDEPSAYLDSAQRMNTSRMIRRVIENSKKSAFIVEHDIYFIDLVADRLMVFSGESGVSGRGSEPMGMKDGMNAFLKSMDITFRRDGSTARPRINKLGSRLDREQKGSGAYYYDE